LKIDRALRITLANQPHVGRFYPARNYYRYPVTSTPFVIYYRIKGSNLIVVAMLHGAQDRTEFERD
jgi:plasmid stabilization system protein ParE